MDPQAPSPSPLAAHCQLHAGQPFTAVCPRCGTYMCNVCTEGGRYPSCPGCRERTGVGAFPFTRSNYTIGGLFQHATDSYKKNWAVLAGAVLLMFVALMMLGGLVGGLAVLLKDNPALVMTIQVIMYIPQFVVQGVFSLGIINMMIKAVNGQKAEIGDVFTVWNRLGAWFAQSFISGAIMVPVAGLIAGAGFGAYALTESIGLTSLAVLATVPLFFFIFVGLVFAGFELVAQPKVGAVAALRNSWQIASGKRFEIVLIGFLAGLVYMAGAIACGIGALFTAGLAGCMFTTYYLALRNGAQDLQS